MSRKMTSREPLIRPATPAEVVAEITKLRDQNAQLQELLRGVGANRYWEGRWRDEKAENERLRSEFKRFMGICGEGAELSRAIDFIDKADWERAHRALHNHEGVQHD